MIERLERLARGKAAWIAVVCGGLAVRLAFLFTAPPGLPWPDGRAYELLGWRLLTEHHYAGGYILAPGYTYFIAGVYSIVGRNLFALRLVQVLLSTLAVGLAGRFGAACFTPAVGLVAAALLAFHPVIAFLPITQYIDDVLILVSVLVFGGMIACVRRPSVPRWLGLGALYGVFMLIKPVTMLYLPGLALGVALELRRTRAFRAAYGIVFALALAAVLAPWTLRNYAEFGRFMPVSGGSERYLWMANNDEADGWHAGPPRMPDWVADSLAKRTDPFEQDRFLGQIARRFIREHPGRAFRLYVIRILNLWSPYPRPMTRTDYSNPAANWAMGLYSAVLFLGVLLGIRGLIRARLQFLLLGMLSYHLIAPVFITALRYRMSMEIILIWTAALGYVGWLSRGRAREPAARGEATGAISP